LTNLRRRHHKPLEKYHILAEHPLTLKVNGIGLLAFKRKFTVIGIDLPVANMAEDHKIVLVVVLKPARRDLLRVKLVASRVGWASLRFEVFILVCLDISHLVGRC
jgi:hypothetical protein